MISFTGFLVIFGYILMAVFIGLGVGINKNTIFKSLNTVQRKSLEGFFFSVSIILFFISTMLYWKDKKCGTETK